MRPSQPVVVELFVSFLISPRRIEFFFNLVLLTIEIAETTRCPDVWHILLLDQLEDEIVLLLRLNRNGVHAILAAEITGFEPVDALVGECGHFTAVEVVVTFVVELFGTWETKTKRNDEIELRQILRAIREF